MRAPLYTGNWNMLGRPRILSTGDSVTTRIGFIQQISPGDAQTILNIAAAMSSRTGREFKGYGGSPILQAEDALYKMMHFFPKSVFTVQEWSTLSYIWSKYPFLNTKVTRPTSLGNPVRGIHGFGQMVDPGTDYNPEGGGFSIGDINPGFGDPGAGGTLPTIGSGGSTPPLSGGIPSAVLPDAGGTPLDMSVPGFGSDAMGGLGGSLGAGFPGEAAPGPLSDYSGNTTGQPSTGGNSASSGSSGSGTTLGSVLNGTATIPGIGLTIDASSLLGGLINSTVGMGNSGSSAGSAAKPGTPAAPGAKAAGGSSGSSSALMIGGIALVALLLLKK